MAQPNNRDDQSQSSSTERAGQTKKGRKGAKRHKKSKSLGKHQSEAGKGDAGKIKKGLVQNKHGKNRGVSFKSQSIAKAKGVGRENHEKCSGGILFFGINRVLAGTAVLAKLQAKHCLNAKHLNSMSQMLLNPRRRLPLTDAKDENFQKAMADAMQQAPQRSS